MVRRGPGRPSRPVARETLIAAAQKAFSVHGFAGTGLAGLAEDVGLRKSSLLHHFRNKEQLYVEALDAYS